MENEDQMNLEKEHLVATEQPVLVSKDLERMFNHRSKLSSLVSPDRIESYKKLYIFLRSLQQKGTLPVHPQKNYLGSSELASEIYKKKYFIKDFDGNQIEHTPEDVFTRLAAFVACVEETQEKQQQYAQEFYKLLYDGMFLPGGRVIAGAGDLYRLKTLANCFVSLIEKDNIESIYKAAYECARTYSYGGGIGVDLSCLRPKDSIVHNAANNSTGAVSFAEIYSLTTGLIGQEGRRGALMLTLDVKHPDSPIFINIKQRPNWVTNQIVEQCKFSGKFTEDHLQEIQRQVRENTQVRFANISLKVTDEFMQAVNEQKNYGSNKLLVYKKLRKEGDEAQQKPSHYSYSIPSKNIEEYSLYCDFDSVEKLNEFLSETHNVVVAEQQITDDNLRDNFGDYIIPLESEKFDLVIHYAGDFMLYFSSPNVGEIKQLVKAMDLWNAFVSSNYKTAEPGLIFWSTMTKYSPSNYVGRPICSTNPCGEVPLEDGGACNLASINLSRCVSDGYTDDARIDWKAIKETAIAVTRFLDNVITWNVVLNPLDKQRKAASESRRLGIGYMGIADMLNQLGIAYDSEKGIAITSKVAKFIANVVYQASALLAKEKNPIPIFNINEYSKGPFFQQNLDEETKELIKMNGLRNVALLSIAPTGTISNVVLGFAEGSKHFIGVSGGVEPIFSLYYKRRSESFDNKIFKVFHATVQAYIDIKGLHDQLENCQSDEDLHNILPDHFFRTAHVIKPEKRVEIQGICQTYIDHSISSTVNLPESIEPETISDIYLMAWKNKLKGITIYRDGSRFPILSVERKQQEFHKIKGKLFRIGEVVKERTVYGDEVIVAPDGTLTTPFHSLQDPKSKLIIQDVDEFKGAEQSGKTRQESNKEGVCKVELVNGQLVSKCSD